MTLQTSLGRIGNRGGVVDTSGSGRWLLVGFQGVGRGVVDMF